VSEFLANDKLLKDINHTFVALIAKVADPTQTHHYRLISLCSTVYKVIAKILVNMLRPLFDRLISPYHSAFVPGRSIHDNILLTHEIVHKFRNLKTKTPWVALKLDMEKAYDKMEWDFINKCLQELGSHQKWIAWINECIPSVTYLIIVNDAPSGFIKQTRGFRQGNPLSSYLFILCMEVLSHRLNIEAKPTKSGIGIKISP